MDSKITKVMEDAMKGLTNEMNHFS